MLDPSSTVREGEFANAQNAAGVPEQVRNIFNRAKDGTRLSDAQRLDFASNAGTIYQGAKAEVENIDKNYGELASRYGLDPTLVIQGATPDPVLQKPKATPSVDPTKAGPGAALQGNKSSYESMSEEELDALLAARKGR